MEPIESLGLVYRLVEENDAEFIVKLRTDPSVAVFLSPTSISIPTQKEWIRGYKEREKKGDEYYFICEQNNIPVSALRFYNITDESVTQGSFIMEKGVDESIIYKNEFFCIEFIFEILKRKIGQLDVKKINKKIIKFHRLFYRTTNEDAECYYMEMDYKGYLKKKQYLKLILDIAEN